MNKPFSIRAMIVDDEEPARSELKYLLEKHSDVEIVGEASNYKDAIETIRHCQPHLLFLDIELPGMSGINFATKVMENMELLIVFATAHEEFAVKAFELNAVDYLLKPFSPKRLELCIGKVRSLLAARIPATLNFSVPKSTSQLCNKLAIEQNGRTHLISTEKIIAVCSSEGKVSVITAQKVYQVNMTLQDLQLRLGDQFFRCHRGFLVNLEAITEIIPWFNGTYNLVLDGLVNIEIPVSRQQASKLKILFNL